MGELKKLRAMSPMSAESTVVRNYLDWMLSIPWKKRSRRSATMWTRPRRCSTTTITALDKVKERILEYLAVQSRANKLKGPILCLVGPPGVGKDLARQVDRQGHGAQLRAHVAGRRGATKRRCAATAGPISAPCPAR